MMDVMELYKNASMVPQISWSVTKNSYTMLSSLFGLFAVAGTCLAVPGTKVLRQATAPVVTVKNGSYSGVHNPTYNHDYFLGIPYAQVSPLNTTNILKPS
jgi:hypothetical protein